MSASGTYLVGWARDGRLLTRAVGSGHSGLLRLGGFEEERAAVADVVGENELRLHRQETEHVLNLARRGDLSEELGFGGH